MDKLPTYTHHDLVSPDGKIKTIEHVDETTSIATVEILGISKRFVGFHIEPTSVLFNLKSTLAQLGLHSVLEEFVLDKIHGTAHVKIKLIALSPIGRQLLPLLSVGVYAGKLFARDLNRRVRNPDYLLRQFGRHDRYGDPLLSFGGGAKDRLLLEFIDGKTVAKLKIEEVLTGYSPEIEGWLPTLAKALRFHSFSARKWLSLNQNWSTDLSRTEMNGPVVLFRTLPLHIRTVFGFIADELLPHDVLHTSANILDPTTVASGDIYEVFGQSPKLPEFIPLEFYTLEPPREYVCFEDRDQLREYVKDPKRVFQAFETAPKSEGERSAMFVVKGSQLINLQPEDWVTRKPTQEHFPGLLHPSKQAELVAKYISEQPEYDILTKIQSGIITSEGALFCPYLPTPLIKQTLLGGRVLPNVKRLYFQYPSQTLGEFFSKEDRAFITDLAKFGLPVYWADPRTQRLLKYVARETKETGMFVPLEDEERFRNATFFGIYGSNLMEGDFELEIGQLLSGLKELQKSVDHPLLNPKTPIALVTGGGPGAMAVGNRIAKRLGLLSCANIVDFRSPNETVNEQQQNPYIDAKMTYRIEQLVERQAEFFLDFPIFVTGGIGTDFELELELVRRKTGAAAPTPIILFGKKEYWKKKISSRFGANMEYGTIKGSEWISNNLYVVDLAADALSIYNAYFSGTLKIGKKGPIYPAGFATIDDIF